MNLDTIQGVMAWGLLVVPLFAIAWAAIWFVSVQAERNRYERYQRFYAIMEQLGRQDGSTPDKMAAAYELRHYRDYADVIAKIFDDGFVREDGGDRLQAELKSTIAHIRKAK